MARVATAAEGGVALRGPGRARTSAEDLVVAGGEGAGPLCRGRAADGAAAGSVVAAAAAEVAEAAAAAPATAGVRGRGATVPAPRRSGARSR